MTAVRGTSAEPLVELRLDRVVDEAWDPPGTLGVRLVGVVDYGPQHAGQTALVRGVVRRTP